jgi:hypothetical protein
MPVPDIRHVVMGFALSLAGCENPSGSQVDAADTTSIDAGEDADFAPDTTGLAAGLAPVVASTGWTLATAEEDPFASEREGRVPCGLADVREESGTFEVDTRACNHVTVRQPSAVSIGVGDTVSVLLWWQTLASLRPAEGHIAVALGNRVLWEERVQIPGPPDVREVSLVANEALAAGQPVFFHVHNHGYNNWKLGHIRVATGPR